MWLLKFTDLDKGEVEVEAWPGGREGWLSREGGHSAQEEREGPTETVLRSTGDTGGQLVVRKAGGRAVLENGGCPQTTEIFLCFRHPPLHDRRRGRWCPVPSALKCSVTAGSSVEARDWNDFSCSLV
ncbi:hypothetical protein ACOMHN_037528 [Nucella lapillus]